MNNQDLIARFKEILALEEKLKKERNFLSLIPIFEESMKISKTFPNIFLRLSQISYCYARIGDVENAENTLRRIEDISLHIDEDDLYRTVALVNFFNSPNEFSESLIKNTIKDWINNPTSSKQTKDIVFDYQDII